MTQSFRRQQLEAKMSRYKRVVIRIQFPDRLVIQALFRTNETGEFNDCQRLAELNSRPSQQWQNFLFSVIRPFHLRRQFSLDHSM